MQLINAFLNVIPARKTSLETCFFSFSQSKPNCFLVDSVTTPHEF